MFIVFHHFSKKKISLEINHMNITHLLVHSFKFITCELNNKCGTYTSTIGNKHANKLRLGGATHASP